MPVRSIVDVSVNDGEFQRFYKLFQQYQKQLGATPMAWQKIAQAGAKNTKAFEELVALEVQSIGHRKMIEQAQERAARLTRSSSEAWRDMARNTKNVATHIRDATGQLMKWAGLTSVFSGLLGAGGLFGIERLAQGVADTRRSSMGTGLSYGEQKAFRNAFGRVVDPDSFLSAINEAQHSATGKAMLFGVGLRGGDLNGDTAQVGLRFLERSRALAIASNPQFDVQTMQARGLDTAMSLQDFQRLRSTSNAEFRDLEKRMVGNTGAFGVSQKDQLAYQNFITTLDAAGDKLNTVFVRALAGLATPLEHLSTAAVDVVNAFLSAPWLKQDIDKLGQGLERFASYVGTDDFQRTVRSIVDDLGAMSDGLRSFISAMGWAHNPGGKGIRDRVNWAHHKRDGIKTPGELRQERAEGRATAWQQLGRIFNPTGNGPTRGDMTEDQLLALVGKKEGGTTGRANAWGAIGRYQIKPDTAREFGIDPATLYTAAGNEAAARKILDTYAKRFNGNLSEILAAYNQGSGAGNVFRRSGDNPASLRPEGRNYVAGTQGVHVTVTNAAGSSVVVSASQMSAGGFPQ